jgi:predicted enzyme related to lactoylglutathione lyase
MRPGAGHPVVHLELHTRDARAARALYAELCGWTPRLVDAGGAVYLALEMGRRVGGGIVECETGRPLWLPYVEVADAERAAERARSLGAKVLLESTEGPAGWRSVVRTEQGAEIAFWQPRRMHDEPRRHGRR